MPLNWVRRIDQHGSWSNLPVVLELRAAPLAAVGYFTVAGLVAIFMLLPVGAAANSGMFAAEAGRTTVSPSTTALVLAAGVMAAASMIWFAYCGYRSVFANARVIINDTIVELHTPGLFNTQITRTPLRAFEGLAVLPQTTIGGRNSGLYLLHPDRSRSPLLMRDVHLDHDRISEIAHALGQKLVGGASLVPASTAAHQPSQQASMSLAAVA